MKNLSSLMKQAAEMQQKMQELQTRLEAMECEGSAGGGMVSVTLAGKGELKRVHIDPKLLVESESEMLEDLLIAAHADAKRKIEAATSEEMQRLTGGLTLPPGLKLPF